MIFDWNYLKTGRAEDLAKASNTVHHAAQLVSLAGKCLLPERDDDSHTAMKWHSGKNLLVGQVIRFPDDYLHLAFDYNNFSLLLVDEDLKVLHSKSLDGHTWQYMYNWLRNTLSQFGFDAGLMSDKLHYELPVHPVDEGYEFVMPEATLLEELAAYRSNGHLIISHFAAEFNSAYPVYIWPHHFDEACFVPLLFDEGEVIGSIHFGLSIPDEFYDSHYLYVTAWKKDKIDYSKWPTIDKPGRWHKKGWKGQVLPGSALIGLPADEQAQTAINFMEQAINNARGLVGWIYT